MRGYDAWLERPYQERCVEGEEAEAAEDAGMSLDDWRAEGEERAAEARAERRFEETHGGGL